MKWRMGGIAVGLLLVSCAPRGVEQAPLDLVILGGRVMDPESGLDGVRNVGIRDGKIVAVTESPLQAREAINAKGLVVAPGVIDLHEHGQAARNYDFQARDGVTTTLELEVGTADVEGWYAARQGKTRINYGVSIGHIPIRMKVMKEAGDFTPSGDAAHRLASPDEIKEMTELMERGFREGAPAMGMGINYTEAASHAEILEMFRVAAKYKASVHVHVRCGGVKEPTSGLAAVEEVIAAAASTGAPLHVVHVTSIGLKTTSDLIALIEGAKRQGLDVTTECYPYTAGSTNLETAIFDPGWQESMGITYKDLQWVKTGERLSEKTFARFR
jgi:N-acyl-D-aspartate/D-glutamate deacylase